MPFNSSIYTDLELPSLNQDNSTYGTIINTYFQALETKLKNLSDRINAAGVGDSSTLAQINSDIDGILPDPYSGDYSTVSTWPAYNTELTALGLSPPETGSEINTFFDGGDFATFANFLNGKLDSLDTLVATAEQDICIANHYSDRILNYEDYITWSLTSTSTLGFALTSSSIASGTYSVLAAGGGSTPAGTGGVRGTSMMLTLPSLTSYTLTDIGTTVVVASITNGTITPGTTVSISNGSSTDFRGNLIPTIAIQLSSAWTGSGPSQVDYPDDGLPNTPITVYDYYLTCKTYTLTLPEPDTSAC